MPTLKHRISVCANNSVYSFVLDSIVYLTRPGDVYQPKLGSFFGDMTSELADYGEGAYIEEFVAGGPKHYAYRVRKGDGSTVEKIKIRGFTVNHASAAQLNFEALKDKVASFVLGPDDEDDGEPVEPYAVVEQPRIGRTEAREVVTRQGVKKHRVVYNKRWVLRDFTTKPFGTCEQQ